MTHEHKITHTGFHAEIFQGNFSDGREYLTKHFGKKAERGFEPTQALELIGAMRSFVDIARGLGISVAAPYGYHLENNHVQGLVNLVESVPLVGPDLKTVLDSDNISSDERLNYLEKYLGLYASVWSCGFPISLDPPPANFCLDNQGSLHYIDCMPPRQKRPDGSLLSEMPEPPEISRQFIEDRYFSPLQARVIYAQLLRTLSNHPIPCDDLKNLIGNYLGQEAYELVNMSKQKKLEVINNPQPTDVDILRIMASEALYSGKLSADLCKSVYKAAHIDTGGILPNNNDLYKAVEILRPIYA
jgi:hypothetical protein